MTEAPFSFRDLLDATTDHVVGWRINSESVEYRCVRCDATFPQTSDGWEAMRAHEFDHGRATRYQPEELDGKLLRVYSVRSVEKRFNWETTNYDTYGIDEATGTAYHLSNRCEPADYSKGGWKWKLTKPTTPSDGQKPTPNVLALLSNGSKSTDAK